MKQPISLYLNLKPNQLQAVQSLVSNELEALQKLEPKPVELIEALEGVRRQLTVNPELNKLRGL